ncbi:MAG: DUF4157 domain-containing protein, partial [Euryarchaeota archaeon]|nr:DUF4157 domain-containing protein [Euryarchaeota archaeon]
MKTKLKTQMKNIGEAMSSFTLSRISPLQRYTTNQAEPSTVPPVVHEVLRSSGQPLDPNTRTFMEPRFGHDFSRVRVHTDTKAAESAQAVNALVYTVGQNIVFGAGRYTPQSSLGRQCLAHELTHVVQQSQTSGNRASRIDAASSRYED